MNRGVTHRACVTGQDVGRPLLEYLVRRFAHSDAAAWQQHLALGLVHVGARVAEPNELLALGDWVSWHRPAWEEPAAPLHFETAFIDDALWVVIKPAGLPTMPGGGFHDHTLLALVRSVDPAWSPMHRLGRGTSGLVLFARGPARAAVQAMFRGNLIQKRYLALATGVVLAPQRLESPIGPVAHPRLGTVHAATPGGKKSATVVESALARGSDSLVTLRLITGRPHQIRIHLAAAGHPLVGDPLYAHGGRPRIDLPGLPGDLGYALHAWRLAFPHPVHSGALAVEAPPPVSLC